MFFLSLRKVLIIPMGQPETINQRIDDTMVKMSNNDLQNTTQKTKDLVTPTPLKPL
jgi:hypothetical protein